MPLTPGHRTLLGDALQPPPGTRVDLAVGTTYSMNLTALLVAPLSFALVEPDGFSSLARDDATPHTSDIDPVRLLESVRRYADRTTIFCQAGGIHLPQFRPILTFIEDSIIEVMPPRDGIFHPKIWALRFLDSAGRFTHRLVVLSRNLTFDRSWDTALILDEDPAGTIEAGPVASFLRGLPDLSIHAVRSRDRRQDVDRLASTISDVRFSAPHPFTGGELLPIGLSDAHVWPFPARAERLLAISPFLTKSAVDKLAELGVDRTLVSRDAAFTMLGGDALAAWQPRVLQPIAETGAEDPVDVESPTKHDHGFLSPPDGLHAKTFVVDLADGTSEVVTGSANLTRAPWGGSVEFDVKLTGPTPTCGVSAVLDGTPGAPGLGPVLEEFLPDTSEGVNDPTYDAERSLEDFHHRLAQHGKPTIDIRIEDDSGDARALLTIDVMSLGSYNSQITTKVWPASLPQANARDLSETTSWVVSKAHVTPFLAVQSTMDIDGCPITRLCVLKAELTGDIENRNHDAMRSLLNNSETVMRYIAFLLGDPQDGTLATELTGVTGEAFFGGSGTATTSLALFEPLVRAAGHDHEALARIHRLVDDIRQMPNSDDLVPDGFEDLWQVVWSVHTEDQT